MDIISLVNFLFPNGTFPSYFSRSKDEYLKGEILFHHANVKVSCPFWPTDVFAFSATMLEKIGLLSFKPVGAFQSHLLSHACVKQVAEEWRGKFFPPKAVIVCWNVIIRSGHLKISDISNNSRVLACLHFLLRCSDEASVGLGWGVEGQDSIFNTLYTSVLKFNDGETGRSLIEKTKYAQLLLGNVPATFCSFIPPERAAVAPKSIAAEVGYTIRSLSHNLALIEPEPKLKVNWYLTEEQDDEVAGLNSSHFNILFVPYPFNVSANCIVPSDDVSVVDALKKKRYAYFKVNPTWLPSPFWVYKKSWLTRASIKVREVSGAMQIFEELIQPLLKEARTHSSNVDCILLPECALTEEIADEIAEMLYAHEYIKGLRLFVTGAISKGGDSVKPKNKAFAYFFNKAGVVKNGHTKHHRWKMDTAQTRRYGLSTFTPDVNIDWWEDIDVSERKLPFYAIRQHACMTVLICEDLARNDPALPAVRAIGPNLVLALLMDGPQIPARWPGRYATVLADDPGSAVLTVTSAAMVDRSNRHESAGVRSVALWKHHSGRTESLVLSKGDHGFLLSLSSYCDEQITMDNRSDDSNTRRFELMGSEPLKLSRVPQWL